MSSFATAESPVTVAADFAAAFELVERTAKLATDNPKNAVV